MKKKALNLFHNKEGTSEEHNQIQFYTHQIDKKKTPDYVKFGKERELCENGYAVGGIIKCYYNFRKTV